MTFSLVARCERSGQVGVGATTAMLGVGKLVSHAFAGVGAAASQAWLNPYLAIDGLRLMADGMAADDALNNLIEKDPGKQGRQVGFVDIHGRSAAFTGEMPKPWAGHRTGEGWACQGNRLVGPQVLDETIAAFLDHPRLELVNRLLLALKAGEAVGGDWKGHHSATIFILDTEEYPLWDLRIDESDDPMKALEALYEAFRDKLIPQLKRLPTRENPTGNYDFSHDEEAT